MNRPHTSLRYGSGQRELLGYDSVLLVGDTHANLHWWTNVVGPAALSLGVDAILQLGDFGWWPDAGRFRQLVCEGPVPTWFLDGNHEYFPDLHEVVSRARRRDGISDAVAPVALEGNLGYLPRGARLCVSGCSVLCVGGAHSIDRVHRKVGVSWFPHEAITTQDVERASDGGHADVLLCHDAPAGWVIPGLVPDEYMDTAWRRERPACEAHREALREVFESVTPSHVVHGHYHSAYRHVVTEPWGLVTVDGLDCDGGRNSLAVLSGLGGVPIVERVTA